jgi:hypothetical protein
LINRLIILQCLQLRGPASGTRFCRLKAETLAVAVASAGILGRMETTAALVLLGLALVFSLVAVVVVNKRRQAAAEKHADRSGTQEP